MSQHISVAKPPGVRHLGPDLARGVMLLLIAMAYATVYAGGGFMAPATDGAIMDRIARLLSVLLLDNRAFPMFAVLFGYGLTWSVGRQLARGASESEARRLLRRRGLFLLLFGAVHAFLVFPGEILTSYGVAALLTGWLLFRPDRTVVKAVWWLLAGYAVTVPLAMIVMTISAASSPASLDVAGYGSLGDWIYRLSSLVVTPPFLAVSYPLFLAVVLGYLAGRRKLLDEPRTHRRQLKRIAVGGIVLSIAGALPAALISVGGWDPGTTTAGLVRALQVLTGVAGGAGYAALFGLIGARMGQATGMISQAVIAVGQRSLTCYLLNSVLVALILHPDLIGLGTRVDEAGALLTALAVWMATSVLALLLARADRQGPLDALMRHLIQRQGTSAPAQPTPPRG